MKTNLSNQTNGSLQLNAKKGRSADEWRELLYRGCFLGMVLFSSASVCLGLYDNGAEIERLYRYIPVALVVYLLIGCALTWLQERPEGGLMSKWFKGSAAVYWCGIFTFISSFIAWFIPGVLRMILLVNVAILIGCWIVEYRGLIRTAKELNGEMKKNLYLVEDLAERPRNAEAFCMEIEAYCRKNGNTLEFIKREKPAEILMNGRPYYVELDSFYSQFGPMYALKFKVGGNGKASASGKDNKQ